MSTDTDAPFAPHAPDRMGDRFVHAGLLTAAQASRAAELQARDGLRFGEAAVKLGFITDQDVQRVLSPQFHYAVAPAGERRIDAALAVAHAPFGAEAEAIRRIRAELAIRLQPRVPMAFAVVSPNPGEGRSYLAASLAIAFSQAGNRTLFVNADLRESGQRELFVLPPGAPGLSTMLAGRTPPVPGEPVPDFPFLHVLPAGPRPPNPVEILYDDALQRLLAAFQPGFEVVVVDTPAAGGSSDAQVIAQQIGACVLVGRKDRTAIAELNAARAMLDTAGVQILGTVYNAFDRRTGTAQAVHPRRTVAERLRLFGRR